MDNLNDIISGLKWGKLDPVEAHERVLLLFNVSNRRELLLDFAEWLKKDDDHNLINKYTVDAYLESI